MSQTRSLPFRLRPATARDLPDLTTLFFDTITTVNAADYDAAQIDAWRAGAFDQAGWLMRIAEQHFRVAERGKTVVGFGSLTNEGYLDLLYVHRDAQRQGIARRILDELEHRTRTRGLSKISTDASRTARPFFERYGFTVVREQRVTVRGVELVNFRMQKTLA